MARKKILNALLKPIGFEAVRRHAPDFAHVNSTLLAYKKQLAASVVEGLGGSVVRGSFEGLSLAVAPTWSEFDRVAKLVGAYERELHPAIEDIVARDCDAIANIGAADGYYAFGLKQRLPNANVFTIDINRTFDRTIEEMMRLNGVAVSPVFDFAFDQPGPTLEAAARPAFVIDCEGCEIGITSMPPAVRRRACLLVELHETISPGITDTLVKLLSETHDVRIVDQEHRDQNLYPELAALREIDAFVLLCEFRERGQWLYATPRAEPG